MTGRIDHAAEAARVLAATTEPGESTYGNAMGYAQVHATLALAEQQRIANLIALYHRDPLHQTGSSASDFAEEAWDHLADSPIRRALGLDK